MLKYKNSILTVGAIVSLYLLYTYDLSVNPPGFYIDEVLAAFNAHQLSVNGQGEFGTFLPLYFPVLKLPPPHDFLGWADPVQIYLLAGLFLVFAPSYLLPRLLSSTLMFAACLLLGRLGWRISESKTVGIITALSAMLTPWLFETGRLAFGSSLYPFAVAVLLTAIYSVSKKEKWPLWGIAAVAASLALCTYTYSIGRLLGPLLAFGLIVFAFSREGFKNVLKTWIGYALTLVPLVIFHFTHPGALAGRFNMTVGIVSPDKSYFEIAFELAKNYFVNLNPYTMLFMGDSNLRHHLHGTGSIYLPTLLLAVAGIVLIFILKRKELWWRYVLFGLVVSVIPASLTRDPFHSLRLIAFPIFLITLTIPAMAWLAEKRKARENAEPSTSRFTIRRGILDVAVLVILVQAVLFFNTFWKHGTGRGAWFDEAYPGFVESALNLEQRPIYLVDGAWGQAYLHAYWYGIVNGIDPATFVHVAPGQRPPVGAVVISSEDKCSNCLILSKKDTFLLYIETAQGNPLAQ